jgi:hypothetical protein
MSILDLIAGKTVKGASAGAHGHIVAADTLTHMNNESVPHTPANVPMRASARSVCEDIYYEFDTHQIGAGDIMLEL